MTTARRDVLKALLGASAAALVAPRSAHARLELLARDAYRLFPVRRGAPLRVTGRVASGGKGVPGVSVTDGLAVTRTGADGRYTLLSDSARSHVAVTVPAGYEIPRSDTGTAAFHRPLSAAGEQRADFDLRRLTTSDEAHATLFLADVQTEDGEDMGKFLAETVPDVKATVAGLAVPVTGVAVGDIMWDRLALYAEYERGVREMGVPFFQVVGNHDLDQTSPDDAGSTATFTGRFGPRYYSFDRGAVHYVVLDDVLWRGKDYIGQIGSDQLSWLANDLAHVERGRTVIVAIHIPALGGQHVRRGQRTPDASVAVTNREALYRLLEPYRAHIIAGHTHEMEHVREHGVHEHVLGTVCGAWWTGPICADGTPNGYAVYEVKGDEVRWRYKATGHPAAHQLRAYAAGGDPAAPGAIVANVFDWEPSWRVVWYQDGDRGGVMTPRVGRDPLSVTLHSGDALPAKRGWVDPYRTAHLLYATPSRPGGRITVEATDGFGRVYTATVPAAGG